VRRKKRLLAEKILFTAQTERDGDPSNQKVGKGRGVAVEVTYERWYRGARSKVVSRKFKVFQKFTRDANVICRAKKKDRGEGEPGGGSASIWGGVLHPGKREISLRFWGVRGPAERKALRAQCRRVTDEGLKRLWLGKRANAPNDYKRESIKNSKEQRKK